MNCRDLELLLSAERDGALTETQRTEVAAHLSACPACCQFQNELVRVAETVQRDAFGFSVPDAAAEWERLQSSLRARKLTVPRRRPLLPMIWLGIPVAAAAAVGLAFFLVNRASIGSNPPDTATQVASAAPAGTPNPESTIDARADYVEAGDVNASTVVYVDKDSGWLVVWAADPNGSDSKSNG